MPRLTAPPRALRLVLIAGVLPALAFGLAACDSGGGMDDDPPPTTDSVTVSAEAVTDDGSRIDSAAIAFDGTKAGTGYAEKTYEKDGDQSVSVSASEDDYVNTETSIDLSADQSISLEMLKELPETTTVPVENVAADGDTLVTGTVTWEDSVVAEDVRSAEVAIPASREEGKLCVQESDLFAEGCISLTLTSDFSETQPITIKRKTVELTVIPDPPYGDRSQTDVTVYEPFRADSTKFTGEKTVELAKRKNGLIREVETDLITDDPEKTDHDHDHLDRLAADTSVTAHSGVELTAQPTLLPACSDNMNSIPQDPFEKDQNDPGCAQDDGFGYDPNDDNEIQSLRQRLTGVNFSDSTLVSGQSNERSIEIWESDFPKSITVAVGEVRLWLRNKRLSDISKQGFRVEIESKKCNAGEYTYSQLSDRVADPDTANGWQNTRVHGLTRFGGRCYKLTLKKAQPYGGPENIVLQYAPNEDNDLGQFIITYYYEPDHPELQGEDGKMASLNTTPKSGQCRKLPKGRICTNVAIEDLPPLVR
jgi:hypothetical protein